MSSPLLISVIYSCGLSHWLVTFLLCSLHFLFLNITLRLPTRTTSPTFQPFSLVTFGRYCTAFKFLSVWTFAQPRPLVLILRKARPDFKSTFKFWKLLIRRRLSARPNASMRVLWSFSRCAKCIKLCAPESIPQIGKENICEQNQNPKIDPLNSEA